MFRFNAAIVRGVATACDKGITLLASAWPGCSRRRSQKASFGTDVLNFEEFSRIDGNSLYDSGSGGLSQMRGGTQTVSDNFFYRPLELEAKKNEGG